MTAAAAAALGAAGLLLAGCGSGGPGAAGRTTTTTTAVPVTTTTTTPATTAPTTTTAPVTTTTSVQAALQAAVAAYQASQGIPAANYQVTGITVSTVDPTWARFTVVPTAAADDDYQGGYGFLHQSGGSWTVVGFGTAAVGCSPESGAVPMAVIAGFGGTCPATAG